MQLCLELLASSHTGLRAGPCQRKNTLGHETEHKPVFSHRHRGVGGPETGRPEIAHSSIRPAETLLLLFLNICSSWEERDNPNKPVLCTALTQGPVFTDAWTIKTNGASSSVCMQRPLTLMQGWYLSTWRLQFAFHKPEELLHKAPFMNRCLLQSGRIQSCRGCSCSNKTHSFMLGSWVRTRKDKHLAATTKTKRSRENTTEINDVLKNIDDQMIEVV